MQITAKYADDVKWVTRKIWDAKSVSIWKAKRTSGGVATEGAIP